jgi:hypothetical protein
MAKAGMAEAAIIAAITSATANNKRIRFNAQYLLSKGEMHSPTITRNKINNGSK